MRDLAVPVRVIVAATDVSPSGERALAWAAELAARRDAELRLVHWWARAGCAASVTCSSAAPPRG
jgi:hypothetical protein